MTNLKNGDLNQLTESLEKCVLELDSPSALAMTQRILIPSWIVSTEDKKDHSDIVRRILRFCFQLFRDDMTEQDILDSMTPVLTVFSCQYDTLLTMCEVL